ncbi:MAG: response regulator transcription factor [Rikenellaceae bacterium]|nr:response regulator transcription factor [Rikenellaceae bacterium]
MEYTILLVDDETDILEFMSYNLHREGYRVYTATTGVDAVRTALEVHPHLIVLDVMMPEMNGMETCAELRRHKQTEQTLIMFLTARSEDESQIAGFEAGADDYITKPVRVQVLVSRIKALLKRIDAPQQEREREQKREPQPISIDRERFVVTRNGHAITLPRKEFALLELLHSRPSKVFTRDEIFHRVWGEGVVVGDRTIDVHIRKLRKKIGDDHIVTVKGVGYKYEH